MSRSLGARAYRAVVFDLFGTLIEFDGSCLPTLDVGGVAVPSTIPRYASVLRRYVPGTDAEQFARALRAASDELRRECEESLIEAPSRLRFRRALERIACPRAVLDEAAVILSRAHHEGINAATVFPPGRRAVLARAAAQGPVGLVSNFDDTASAFAILARHDILRSLATVVVSEAVGLRKPHPLTLTTALHALGLEPADVLFVGDSLSADVGVAQAVGADAAWIDHGGEGVPSGLPPPRYVLRTLEELHAILDGSRR